MSEVAKNCSSKQQLPEAAELYHLSDPSTPPRGHAGAAGAPRSPTGAARAARGAAAAAGLRSGRGQSQPVPAGTAGLRQRRPAQRERGTRRRDGRDLSPARRPERDLAAGGTTQLPGSPEGTQPQIPPGPCSRGAAPVPPAPLGSAGHGGREAGRARGAATPCRRGAVLTSPNCRAETIMRTSPPRQRQGPYLCDRQV